MPKWPRETLGLAIPARTFARENCDDGIERITTQTVFDILEIPQRNRSASACRRLAKLMTEVGWIAVRVRGLTRGVIWNKFAAMPAMLETSTDPARLIDAWGS